MDRGNPPEFWLNIQHTVELWDVRHNAYAQESENVRLVKPYLAQSDIVVNSV
jgi:plasmid maintenance system antidote protein VapI